MKQRIVSRTFQRNDATVTAVNPATKEFQEIHFCFFAKLDVKNREAIKNIIEPVLKEEHPELAYLSADVTSEDIRLKMREEDFINEAIPIDEDFVDNSTSENIGISE